MDDNKYGHLFYCNKDGFDKLNNCLAGKIIVEEFERYLFETLETHCTELLRVCSYDIDVVINNPPIWEVIIIYTRIPFTKTDYLNQSMISIDKCYIRNLVAAGVDNQVANTITKFMQENEAIDTVDKAETLAKSIKAINTEIADNLFSKDLVGCLMPH